MKPSHRLKAQTSRIVSSFKAPAVTCSLKREFRGHRDGVWDVNTSKNFPLVGSASAGISILFLKSIKPTFEIYYLLQTELHASGASIQGDACSNIRVIKDP